MADTVFDCALGRELTPEEVAALNIVAPGMAVPEVVSPRQAKLALLQAGKLDAAEDAVSGADRAAQISWSDAQEFRRDDPLLNAIGSALGMNSEQIDDLFRLAAGF